MKKIRDFLMRNLGFKTKSIRRNKITKSKFAGKTMIKFGVMVREFGLSGIVLMMAFFFEKLLG
jgi:hypothetical protein